MIWTRLGMSLVAAIGAMVAVLRKRPVHATELGAVSDRWIARHRADAS